LITHSPIAIAYSPSPDFVASYLELEGNQQIWS